MDSDNFSRPMWHLIDIASIKIGSRYREEVGDIRSLTESIKTHGLFHPIVLDRNYNLLVGFRRITAHNELKRTQIYCQFLDEVDELTAREIELEENLARKNLTWLEETKLTAEIDRLKKLKYGQATTNPVAGQTEGWSLRDTAQALNVGVATVHRAVARMEAITYAPYIADAPTAKAADREIDRLVQEIETELNLRARAVESAATSESIIFGDCVDKMSQMPTDSVDCIITDPPYGVDVASVTTDGGHRNTAEYEDDPVSVQALLRAAFHQMRRVLRHQGHMYVFCSSNPEHQILTIASLRSAGFDIEPIPLIWVKDTHTTVNWDYRFAPSYESVLFCSNKQRRLNYKSENIFVIMGDTEGYHTAQKPIALLQQFLQLSTAEGEVVLDPFMGSGSTLVAALRLNRRYIGIENNEAIFNVAKLRIMDEQAQGTETKNASTT